MSTTLTENSIPFKKMNYFFKQSLVRSFTVNPNQTLLYIQGSQKIFIMQLFSRMGQIKMLGLLFCYTAYLICPVFMKKSNQFFTAGFGAEIYLWTFDQKLGWKITQQLQDHNSMVMCIILNKEEDLVISGSLDRTIRFWNKAEKWYCKQTLDVASVMTICLNQTETQLIACGSQSKVIVLELKKSEEVWSLIQNIEVSEQEGKLCFLNDTTFIFLSKQSGQITMYKQDQQDLMFKQHKIIQLGVESYSYIPIKYIQKQNLLLINTGKIIYLIKYTEQEEFKILLQIHFKSFGIATINDDAQYIITWDESAAFSKKVGPKKIQILMFKQFY